MKFLTGVLPWLLGVSSVLASASLSNVKRVTSLPIVSNKFIVEVTSPSAIPGKRSLTSPHETLYQSLRARGVGFQVDREFNAQGLFVGAALTLSNAQDVAELEATPGVTAIRPVKIFAAPKPVKSRILSGPNDSGIPPDSESTHVMTGVDKLHAQGIIGTGIKIGIIDTGVDYTHPSLGGGFGPGHKVAGGKDLVGDNYDGTNTPVPDDDPLDQCAGHGTHVAGIIGANPGNEFNISGVAYGATLSAYRVFGCSGHGADDVMMEALLLGFSDGQDILTLSMGGADSWTESSAAVVASRIAASGKIVTIAAGNDGAFGSWFTSNPGNGIDVISVASVDNVVIPLQNATVQGAVHDPIPYFQTTPLHVTKALPIFATSTDITVADDACNPLPNNTPDLSPLLVIVRRGGCTFDQKLTNIAAKGGKIAFIYNNVDGFASIEVGKFTAPLIQAHDGEFLVSQFAAKVDITISFPQSGGAFNFPDPAGGLVSNFSSYGPTTDLFFKPAVAAPGGDIVSTFPVPLGSFALLSGTSMATPFLAGSAALLFNVKGASPAVGRSARTLFETTAQRVPSSRTDGDPLQTVTQQGAGLVNVFNAIYTTTVVSPGEFLLNDTAHFKGVQPFTVQNTGSTAQTFTLSHIPAGTALTVTPSTSLVADGPVPLSAQFATVKFTETSFTVNPGETREIVASITPPKGVDASTFPVYSGFVQIKSSTESLQIPYMGLAASLKDKKIIDDTDVFFGEKTPAFVNSTGNIQADLWNYTFVGDDIPTLIMRLAFGTPLLRLDLVDPNIKIDTTLNRRDELGHFFSFSRSSKSGSFAKVQIIGALLEIDFATRNSNDTTAGSITLAFPEPTFANGAVIPNGIYRVLLRALKVTGDPTKEKDYESWLSPRLGIAPGK